MMVERIWDTDHRTELIVEPGAQGVVKWLELTIDHPDMDSDVTIRLSPYGVRNLRLALQKWERENKESD